MSPVELIYLALLPRVAAEQVVNKTTELINDAQKQSK